MESIIQRNKSEYICFCKHIVFCSEHFRTWTNIERIWTNDWKNNIWRNKSEQTNLNTQIWTNESEQTNIKKQIWINIMYVPIWRNKYEPTNVNKQIWGNKSEQTNTNKQIWTCKSEQTIANQNPSSPWPEPKTGTLSGWWWRATRKPIWGQAHTTKPQSVAGSPPKALLNGKTWDSDTAQQASSAPS